MKRVIIILLCLVFTIPLAAQTEKKIVILHTNDIHSRLIGYAPESEYTPLTTNDDRTVAGFARMASIIKNEKATNKSTVLVVDAGDFLMGTLFQQLEPVNGFQLRLMKSIGYDAVCIGNHEFDFGDEKLADIINSAKREGGIPPVLLSNAIIDNNDSRDEGLGKLFSENILQRKLIINRDGLKIGFFSLLGKSAVENAAYAAPVKFSRQISTAKRMVKELKDKKCDMIICLSHSGVTREKDGSWGGEDVTLARKVKGISVIISGHTHTKLDKPVMVNGIPVVQTGSYGKYVGRLALTYAGGKVTVDSYKLIPVDDSIAGDPVVNGLVNDQKKLVSDDVLKPLGMDYDKKVAEAAFPLECDEDGDYRESNLGPLVADAIYSYINNHTKSGLDVSMVAVGVIRDNIVPGFQCAPDIFKIMSMGSGNDNVPGYPLSRIYITGHELKNVLEVLEIAAKSDPENYCFYSGIRVQYDPDGGFLKKIRKIEITDRKGNTKEVDLSRKNKTLYSIAANSYMLRYVGIIKKETHGLVNVVPKDAAGKPVKDMNTAVIDIDESKPGLQEGKEWLALMEFLSSMKDVNGNGVPDISEKYRTAVKTFYTVGSR